ncbi:hypothetical protein ILUMI_12139 [Ignelater luminosus]|uniref:HTH psq-type domain-containing protein n=1 Tax=Ignelater luminosus TaxID=2038154 RepID=A0A8K0CX26_IGNLU|nr:hypothetical protein ILUMI_12139 [Ignelater luminosus]
MPLTVTDVSQIVALSEDGHSRRYVSRSLGIPRTTIRDAWNRYLETDRFLRQIGSRRKRATTAADDRFVVLNTLRRRLVERGSTSRRPAAGPRLLPRHRRIRLEFARLHAN